MKYYFVCKKYEPEKGQYFGDLIPVDSMAMSTSDKRVAEKMALRKFLESAGKEDFFVVEAKVCYQPAIKNVIGEEFEEDAEAPAPPPRPKPEALQAHKKGAP